MGWVALAAGVGGLVVGYALGYLHAHRGRRVRFTLTFDATEETDL